MRDRLSPGELERIAKALADARRFEILEAISAAGELSCKALVERFPIAQATVSHHLKELLIAGLVEVRQEGQCRYYRVRQGTLDRYLDEIRSRVGGGEARQRR